MFLLKPKGGMYREFIGIMAIAKPKDNSLYHSLLPEQLSMPEEASVLLFIADYLKVVPWPIRLVPWRMSRYQEGAVSLKVNYLGEDAWFCLTMPVSSWLSMAMGRYLLGFPKYIADEISLEETNGGWCGRVKHSGALKLQLEFESGISRDLAPWEQKILNNEAFFIDPFLLLYPAERGPKINKVWFDEYTPPRMSPELGMVRIRIDSKDPWAGLFDTNITYPGMYNYFVGASSLVSELFNEG